MKKLHLASALILAITSGSLLAQPIATVNGESIDSNVIDAQVKALTTANKNIKDSAPLRQNLAEQQIVRTIIAQEAKRLKLDQSPEYKQALAQARASAKQQGADKKSTFATEWAAFESNLLGQAYAAHIAAQNPVTEKDIHQAYDQFNTLYKGSQEVLLGIITTDSKEKAEKAIKDIDSKKSFKDVSNQYSIDPDAKKAGGILPGYVPLKDLEQGHSPLYPAIKDLKKGEHTAPIQDGNAYGIFYISDRRDVQVPSYDQVKDRIGNDLQAERIDSAIQTLLKKANVKSAK